jgi:type VI protein secretion system component Hcp
MTKMMESLESRQMFSATSVDPAVATDTSADASAPADFVSSDSVDKGSPALFKACCTGVHYKTVTVVMR